MNLRLLCPIILLVLMLATTNCLAETSFHAEELIFPLHGAHNHAPGIVELPGGELLVSWYRGAGERKADDVAVYGARRAVGATSWSEPFLMADTPGFPDCNTCLWLDPQQRVWLFWPVILANSWESSLTQFQVSSDYRAPGSPKWLSRGTIWLRPDDFAPDALRLLDRDLQQILQGRNEAEKQEIDEARRKLGDKLFQRLGWQPRCKPTVLPSGRILLPLYTDTFSISLMAISDDQGQTWHASKPLIGFGNIQPTVLRRDNGTLVAYMRENGPHLRVRVCESSDEGESWGVVSSTELPNPGAGIDGVRLRNGHWVLVYNDTTDHRHSLAIARSTDEGRHWLPPRHLEHHADGSYHYPAVIQGANDRIHVVYSYFVDRGKSMKHVEINEAWIEEGSERN